MSLEGTTIPVVVNGRTVRLRGWVEADSASPSFGQRKFEGKVTHSQVADLAGMTVQGARVVISYTDVNGTRALAVGDSFYPEPGGVFVATYA